MQFFLIFLFLFLSLSFPVYAHNFCNESFSFYSGFVHPFTGVDHLFVMVGVGLWAAHLGGRALWVLPLSFISAMLLGFVLAWSGIEMPFVEPLILLSMVTSGLLSAFLLRFSTKLAMAIVLSFAIFHGYVHSTACQAKELFSYSCGFSVATALLHLLGIFMSWVSHFLGSSWRDKITRVCGMLTFFAAFYMAFS
ncbi:MAG: urease accessory protein [Candidatus Tokpelaia sp. JSC161]|jgi:urease accessory protein|nr:MAG: urease accessory protein [Candidatus Tokpelaia sp. JSC161]